MATEMARTLLGEKDEVATHLDCRGSEQLIRSAEENERQCVINITSVYSQVGAGNQISIPTKPGPVLEVVRNIHSPVNLGRGRRDFPDEKKDYAVHLLALKSPNTTERIDCKGGDYYVDVADIKKENALETDTNAPDCLWKRNSKKTCDPGFVAFWFRFFEPNTKYKITFALVRIVSSKDKSKNRRTLHEATVVAITRPSKSKSVRVRSRDSFCFDFDASEDDTKAIVPFNLSPAAPSERSLELTEISNQVMKQLQFPRDNGGWEQFTEVSRELSVQFPDIDSQLTILLEESVVKCYLNRMDESKALIEKALSQTPQAVNSRMLMGRAYHYLAGVHRREKNLGEAEKCVQLAAQNFHGSGVSLDQSFLAYEQASVLFDFCFCFPCVSPKLVKQAKDNLKKCIAFCTQLEEMSDHGGQQLYVKKHHFAFIKIAMLLLNCRNTAGREQEVSKDNINTAQESLHALESKYWNGIAQGEKVQYYLARSDLEYRLQNFQEAENFASEALDLSQHFCFNTEIKPARERLEHIRQKLQQFQFHEETGSESHSAFSESESSSSSDGQTADVSSCTESDWLPCM